MTAAELIAELSKLPPDTPICTNNSDLMLVTPPVVETKSLIVDKKPDRCGNYGYRADWGQELEEIRDDEERRTVTYID